MESILEVEEDCFSTNKTHNKNDLIAAPHFIGSSSQARSIKTMKEDILISDFSNLEILVKTDKIFKNSENQKLTLSFGKSENVSFFDKITPNLCPISIVKSEPIIEDLNFESIFVKNKKQLKSPGFSQSLSHNTSTISFKSKKSPEGFNFESNNSSVRSKSKSSSEIKERRVLNQKTNSKILNSSKPLFKSFNQILSNKIQPAKKIPNKSFLGNDLLTLEKQNNKLTDKFSKFQGNYAAQSPFLKIDGTQKFKAFASLKY